MGLVKTRHRCCRRDDVGWMANARLHKVGKGMLVLMAMVRTFGNEAFCHGDADQRYGAPYWRNREAKPRW